mmetsp:Transcript_47974/g.135538  ORF Transcript_47974/g.135538 Transcript_47974/m.135538 type:complete len:214 (+) Transcript_47974:110-751(+)
MSSSGMVSPLSVDVERQVQQGPAGEAPSSKRRAFGLGFLSGGLACACIAAVAFANTGGGGHAQYLGKFTPGLLPPQARAPATARRSSVPLAALPGRRAPARGAPAQGVVPDKSNYKGNGEYLDAAGVAALPKASGDPARPGWNMGGDAMFFGEGMLKDQLVPEWEQSLEYTNWGSPLPTASGATVQAYQASKERAKLEELESKSRYPYDFGPK